MGDGNNVIGVTVKITVPEENPLPDAADSLTDNNAEGITDTEITTGDGDDHIWVNAETTGFATSINGVGDLSIDTGKGDDKIEVLGKTLDGDETDIEAITGLSVDMGSGDDSILGTAIGEAREFMIQDAINGLSGELGSGDDVVKGKNIATAADGVEIEDIRGTVTLFGGFSTGDELAPFKFPWESDHDTITGEVIVDAGDGVSIGEFGFFGAVGLLANELTTGRDDDLVKGSVDLKFGSEAFVLGANGLIYFNDNEFDENDDPVPTVEIETGTGDDTVIGFAKLSGEDAAQFADVNGIHQENIFPPDIAGRDFGLITDGGDDLVLGKVSAKAGFGSIIQADGIDNAKIDTGADKDTVIGHAVVEAGGDGTVSDTRGIADSVIATGNHDDTVVGKASATAGIGSVVNDINGIHNTDINTGEGDDRILGESSIDGELLASGFGDGIKGGTIETEGGDDLVIGIGAGTHLGDTSEGIDGATIFLGDGDDQVFARGSQNAIDDYNLKLDLFRLDMVVKGAEHEIGHGHAQGNNGGLTKWLSGNGLLSDVFDFNQEPQDHESLGVKDVTIDGGRGDDVFDLHSGTGTVDGGDDFDTLVLALDSTDYDFEFTGGNGTAGTITKAGVTELDITNIEFIQFDDGLYAFDDLFVVP